MSKRSGAANHRQRHHHGLGRNELGRHPRAEQRRHEGVAHDSQLRDHGRLGLVDRRAFDQLRAGHHVVRNNVLHAGVCATTLGLLEASTAVDGLGGRRPSETTSDIGADEFKP